MSRTKEPWYLRVSGLGGLTFRKGRHVVTLIFQMDREPGRLIYAEMAPRTARMMSEALRRAADEVEALNAGKDVSYPGDDG